MWPQVMDHTQTVPERLWSIIMERAQAHATRLAELLEEAVQVGQMCIHEGFLVVHVELPLGPLRSALQAQPEYYKAALGAVSITNAASARGRVSFKFPRPASFAPPGELRLAGRGVKRKAEA